MKIGNYKVYSILTSQFSLDGGAMFGIIPKTLWEKEAPADNYNRINILLLKKMFAGASAATGAAAPWPLRGLAAFPSAAR